MVEVRLHGELAREFGRVWHLDILRPGEAVAAIDANMPGFRQKIRDLARRGMQFRVRTLNYDYKNETIGTTLGRAIRLDIIPIVVGASAGARFVVGALLIAAALVFPNPFSNYMIMTGISLMLGSVVQWLTPQPKRSDNPGGVSSWSLDGPSNTVDQGLPVPIIYGEVLTGAYTISGGISISQLNSTTSNAPVVQIGGELSRSLEASGGGTAVFRLSAGTAGLSEPITYAWTYTGFAGTAAVRIVGANTATLRLEVDYVEPGGQSQTLEGIVSVAVTGLLESRASSEEPETASVSSSASVQLYLTKASDGGGG